MKSAKNKPNLSKLTKALGIGVAKILRSIVALASRAKKNIGLLNCKLNKTKKQIVS
jgi:hypothetical protein